LRTYRQSTNEERRYGWDWSDEILIDQDVTTSTWTVDAGITAGNANSDRFSSTIDVSGGTANTRYKFVNKVTTTNGLDYEKSFYVFVFAS